MSVDRKQHADLIRHSELNALRRLMSGGQMTAVNEASAWQENWADASLTNTDAISKIDALELQMLPSLSTRQAPQNLSDPPTTQAKTLAHAARVFADKQFLETHQILTKVLVAQGPLHDHVPTWLALLDFYRATGQAKAFDQVALSFSMRFGRSTPSWISFAADALQASTRTSICMHDQRHQPSESIAKCDWVAPAFLTEGAFAGFDTLIHQAVVQQRPLHLDWRDVSSVDPNYWGVIKIQLNAIAAQKIHCVMYGVPALRQCVDTALPSALLAALALLRCLNEFEAFETLALEYSRVSEISPPDWLGPLCRLELKDGPLTAQLECDGEPQSQSQRQMMRQVHTEESGEHVFALIGEIDQLPADWLGRDPPFSRIERWPVQCDKLVRIGVSATQQLATQLQSLGLQGIRFEFCNVHRLIAALFLQEGLYDIAKIMTRKD